MIKLFEDWKDDLSVLNKLGVDAEAIKQVPDFHWKMVRDAAKKGKMYKTKNMSNNVVKYTCTIADDVVYYLKNKDTAYWAVMI